MCLRGRDRRRRVEVRDASVGLNVSKALDVGVRAAKWGMRWGNDHLPLPCPLPPSHRRLPTNHPPTQPSQRTRLHSTPTVPPHPPPRSPLRTHRPRAATHFTSGREWNKVPPGGMVGPRERHRERSAARTETPEGGKA